MMIGEDEFIFTSVPGVTWALYQFHSGSKKFDAKFDVVSDDWYPFQVQGPKSVEVMEAVTEPVGTDLKSMRSEKMSITGLEFLCLRQGVSGERGFEPRAPAEQAQAVYRVILSRGAEFGIRQLGGRANTVIHVRICFMFLLSVASIQY